MTSNPQRLALVPAEIIDTATKIVAHNTNLWREPLREAAAALMNDDFASFDALMEELWMITEQRTYAKFLQERVENMKHFAVDIWPDLDASSQEFIAQLFWMLRCELPDFS
ncbi:hypothetical protein HJA76_01230 [Rhizobium bangladeshense]|uniref:hypothetical protein n=1 Tax=Rhizobium bangladeshense TaxID=1138189 RepID=UPI001C83BC72|nr:hypothetical protein [Rhizobium bangladeshense]MBX4918353.1 hypothetical protein [Rhizobium bangladeshense]